MKRLLLGLGMLVMAGALPAAADIYNDPLQFTCGSCGTDNGTFIPTQSNNVSGINVLATGNGGINASDFILKVLIPNSFTVPMPEGVSGTIGVTPFSGAASLFTSSLGQGNQWTAGFLESNFLGVTNFGNGAPPNPIGAFLPSTQALDPTATGFYVLLADLGAFQVGQHFTDNTFLLALLNALPGGSWILGDACTSGTFAAGTCVDVTTAQSTALFVNQQLSPVPLPGAAGLFAGGVALLGFIAGRRKVKASRSVLPSA